MDGSKATPAEVTCYRYILKVRSTVGRTFVVFVDLDICYHFQESQSLFFL